MVLKWVKLPLDEATLNYGLLKIYFKRKMLNHVLLRKYPLVSLWGDVEEQSGKSTFIFIAGSSLLFADCLIESLSKMPWNTESKPAQKSKEKGSLASSFVRTVQRKRTCQSLQISWLPSCCAAAALEEPTISQGCKGIFLRYLCYVSVLPTLSCPFAFQGCNGIHKKVGGVSF